MNLFAVKELDRKTATTSVQKVEDMFSTKKPASRMATSLFPGSNNQSKKNVMKKFNTADTLTVTDSSFTTHASIKKPMKRQDTDMSNTSFSSVKKLKREGSTFGLAAAMKGKMQMQKTFSNEGAAGNPLARMMQNVAGGVMKKFDKM